jgi:hypothetical protein
MNNEQNIIQTRMSFNKYQVHYLIIRNDKIFKLHNDDIQGMTFETYNATTHPELKDLKLWNGDKFIKIDCSEIELIDSPLLDINSRVTILRINKDTIEARKISVLNKIEAILSNRNVLTDQLVNFEDRNVFDTRNKSYKGYNHFSNPSTLNLYEKGLSLKFTDENKDFIFQEISKNINQGMILKYSKNYHLVQFLTDVNVLNKFDVNSNIQTIHSFLEHLLYSLYKRECCQYKDSVTENDGLTLDTAKMIVEIGKKFSNTELIPLLTSCNIVSSSKSMKSTPFTGDVIKEIKDNIFGEYYDFIDWTTCSFVGGSLTRVVKSYITGYQEEINRDPVSYDNPPITRLVSVINNSAPFTQNCEMSINNDVDIAIKTPFKNFKDKPAIQEYTDNVIQKFTNELDKKKYQWYRRIKGPTNISIIISRKGKQDKIFDFFPICVSTYTIVKGFHFPCVRCYYNPKCGVRILPSCLIANWTGINIDVNHTTKIMESIHKYLDRGYSFALSKKETENIMYNPVIEKYYGKVLINGEFQMKSE